MKVGRYFSLLLLLFFSLISIGQKPPIDSGTFKNWTAVGSGDISPDGNYACYIIGNQFFGMHTLVVKSIKCNWEKSVPNSFIPEFTRDNRHVVFKTGVDSLCILTLGGDEIEFVSNISSYKLSDIKGNIWLAYQLKNSSRELILRDLNKGVERHFLSVITYQFSINSDYLLLNSEGMGEDGVPKSLLKLVGLRGGEKLIWTGLRETEIISSFSFDQTGQRLAFMVETRGEDNNLSYKLWFYKTSMTAAVILASKQTIDTSGNLQIVNTIPKFSDDGYKLFFKYQIVKDLKPKSNGIKVDIWSYTDTKLQSLQLNEVGYSNFYTAVINIGTKKVFKLELENESMVSYSDDFALIKHEMGNLGIYESHWNLAAQLAFYLVSLENGSRKLLRAHIPNNNCGGLEQSPGGKWIIYYNIRLKNYFSYQLSTGITRNITKCISTNWMKTDYNYPEPILPGGEKWLADDESILISDNFDIWQIDPQGVKKPIALTKGYGRKHLIKFDVFNPDASIDILGNQQRSLILRGFNTITKESGFYRVTLGISADPKIHSMGPYVYGFWNGYGSYNYPPVKAMSSNNYLILRMSATEAPNYFSTSDFKTYIQLSNVQPQKMYNWMTTELIHCKAPNNKFIAGILYKPENFDSSKRYPIIFDIYERRSDELNLFIRPKASSDRINIPWFVSNGYLVCTPDIYYRKGEPGPSAYDAVFSVATYLSKMLWIDGRKMGIQGHSFGGYETNYIVSHTHLFAAACAAAGASDLVSEYGSAIMGGFHMYHEERQQGRIGATLWQRPDLYISNSPIFNADRVVTPLLLVSNKDDTSVPFTQGVEFFTALRRLGKRVWMLQYDGGSHSVSPEMANDYHARMVQFFDHYLKGKAAPRWMTRGISADMKGIEYGLEFDNKIGTPGPGLNLRKK